MEMLMPSRFECIAILETLGTPSHICRHSLMVTEVAVFLGRLLNCNGSKLDLSLVEAAALLHDVGKQQSLEQGGDHALLGAQMLEGIVPPAVAGIVSEHVWLEPSQIGAPLTESVLVNYSDKRVKHEQVVSIEERYHDLIARYAKSPIHRQRLLEKLTLYIELEKQIFSHLNIAPLGVEIMGLTIDNRRGVGSDGNQETDCCAARGRQIG
jgi:uncharacterized protein